MKNEIQPSETEWCDTPDPAYKSEFLQWLDRFAYVGALRDMFQKFRFSQDELNKLRPQIQAHYRLKKEWKDRQHKEA